MKLTPPCYVRVVRVLVEIRDGIRDLAGSREANAINEVIDIEFIETRANLGAFEWRDCQNLIRAAAGIIRRIQSPARDPDFKEKFALVEADLVGAESTGADFIATRPSIFCKSLEFLLGRVNLLRIDAANARCVSPLHLFACNASPSLMNSNPHLGNLNQG